MFPAIYNKFDKLSGELSIKTNALWFLAVLVLIESLWASFAGIRLKDMGESLSIIAVPLSIGLLLDALGWAKRCAQIAYFFALWLGFLIIGTVLTYLAATLHFRLLDSLFAEMDAVLGFNWVKWYSFIQAHSFFRGVLLVAYGSMFPQILVAIIFFSSAKTRAEAEELWWSTMIALIITSFLSGLLPALGTFSYYETSLDLAVHLPDLLALRDGTMLIFPVAVLKGIVTFPSFHAASAILLTYPYGHYKSLFGIVCVINGIMLLSTPSQGGHYLVDVIGGVLVAVFSIFIFRKMTRFKFSGHAAQINGLQVS